MKYLIFLITLTPFTTFSQDYLDTIAEQTCACVLELPDTLKQETRIMKFGFCIMDAAMPYQERIKVDHNIDFLNEENDGERLGELVGIRMLNSCPQELMSLAQTVMEADESEQDELAILRNVRGVVERIAEDGYVRLYVRRGDNKLITLHWITRIDSDIDMPFEYRELVGSELLFHYDEVEVFDPRIDEYRNIFVLTRVEE